MFGRLIPLLNDERAAHLAAAYIWYDFFGVPQLEARTDKESCADLVAAVDSIPAYIARSKYFVVLAPSVQHQDDSSIVCSHASWQSRGWCRLENTIYALLQKTLEGTSTIYIHHTGFIQEAVPLQWLYALPHHGHFTVEIDRSVVEDMVRVVAEERVSKLRVHGPMFDFRFFKAVLPYLSRQYLYIGKLDNWMEAYRFEHLGDAPLPHGWGPLHFASIEGNLDVIEELVLRRADIDRPAPGAPFSMKAPEGLTPLMAAVSFIPDGAVNLEVCSRLLLLRANPEVRTPAGCTALHFAAGAPAGEGVLRQLLEGRADVMDRDGEGATPLHYAAMANATVSVNRFKNIKLLLEHGAEWDVFGGGLDLTPWHFIGTSSAEDVEVFLRFKADPNMQLPESAVRSATKDAIGHLEATSVLATLAVHGTGLTTLMLAAWLGNWETVRVLLDHGADPHLATDTGRRAIEWLTEYGVRSGTTYDMLRRAMANNVVTL